MLPLSTDITEDITQHILLAFPPVYWRTQPGRPRITWLSNVQQDLRHHNLTLQEAVDMAQNRSVEDAVNAWRYAIFELHARNEHDDILTQNGHMRTRNSLTFHFICPTYHSVQQISSMVPFLILLCRRWIMMSCVSLRNCRTTNFVF